jgi:hypothetical protein
MAPVVHDNRTMQTKERFRFVAIVGLVIAMLTAGISLASGAFDTSDEPEPTVCEPVGDGDVVEGDEGEDADTVDEGEEPVDEGEEPVDEGEEPVDEGDTDECDDPAEDDETVENDGPALEENEGDVQAQDYTAADCTEAVGLLPGEEPTEKPVPGELHGLENATAHLLWNCLDHPNHGLVNALTKHTLKLDAWLERQELKAERKAEREAAKAEREAARDAAKAARDPAHAAAKAARELSHSS